jgi:hypothetical protein
VVHLRRLKHPRRKASRAKSTTHNHQHIRLHRSHRPRGSAHPAAQSGPGSSCIISPPAHRGPCHYCAAAIEQGPHSVIRGEQHHLHHGRGRLALKARPAEFEGNAIWSLIICEALQGLYPLGNPPKRVEDKHALKLFRAGPAGKRKREKSRVGASTIRDCAPSRGSYLTMPLCKKFLDRLALRRPRPSKSPRGPAVDEERCLPAALCSQKEATASVQASGQNRYKISISNRKSVWLSAMHEQQASN